jgi:hypothetical protein
MFRKEMEMTVPNEDMYGIKRRSLRDKAVDAIMKRFRRNGSNQVTIHTECLERFLAERIEEAQRLL